ncbi:hypothetical protein [Streptomyces sp. VB1]|uniref:hypothetical protein n=1 Tax=Streptomyces sp. VB1 TaxID=2986803 RepID=UPI002241E452|nr:hypothetical protein [Streptomyces sp. VB1]UZI31021.1 hypothetical protein OH133_24555 [Streptomyces sp. VB1]
MTETPGGRSPGPVSVRVLMAGEGRTSFSHLLDRSPRPSAPSSGANFCGPADLRTYEPA